MDSPPSRDAPDPDAQRVVGSVTVTDEAWSESGRGALLARIYRAEGDGPRPVILDIHGGAWNFGDRTRGELYATALAQAGFVVAAIDFHDGPDYQHPAASRDVVGAVRWLRLNAERLAIDTTSIGMVGSSSGGHLVMYAGVVPNASFHQGALVRLDGELVDPAGTDPTVSYIMALWPVSDPFFRYRYAKRVGMERLVDAHDAFYADEGEMREASVPRIVTAGEAERLPPLLVVQPGEDTNVPVDMTFDLLRSWQNRGGYVEYSYFPDEPHGFGHGPSEATDRMVGLLIDFARRHAGMGE